MDVPYDKLLPALNRLLPNTVLDALGGATRFIRRLRQISASMFVWSVVLSRFGQSTPGFEQARQWFCRLAGSHVWPRPFQMRFKSEAAVRLFERAFEQAVAPWRSARRLSRHPLAKHFADIVLWDSSLVQVADCLHKQGFKGTRAAVASLKVALGISLWGLLPVVARVVPGNRHDMILFPQLDLFKRGTLLLFDKGFACYDRLRTISNAGQHYLCPMRLNGNAQIVAVHHAPAFVRRRLGKNPDVTLRDLLAGKKRIARVWDLDVLVRAQANATDKTSIRTRLVIVPGPNGAQRPYLTNLDLKLWNARTLRELYRLRWQIELVFKELKQHVNLTAVPTKDVHAVQVFVWASLIALALSRAVADWLMPLHEFNGLASALRLAVVTRAVRGNVHLLGYAIQPSMRHQRAFLAAFAERVLEESRRRDPDRDDSLKRLAILIKQQPAEACSRKPEASSAKAA